MAETRELFFLISKNVKIAGFRDFRTLKAGFRRVFVVDVLDNFNVIVIFVDIVVIIVAGLIILEDIHDTANTNPGA